MRTRLIAAIAVALLATPLASPAFADSSPQHKCDQLAGPQHKCEKDQR